MELNDGELVAGLSLKPFCTSMARRDQTSLHGHWQVVISSNQLSINLRKRGPWGINEIMENSTPFGCLRNNRCCQSPGLAFSFITNKPYVMLCILFLDGTMGLLCARFVHQLMAFPPSLVSANYDLLHMETDDHLPLSIGYFSTGFVIITKIIREKETKCSLHRLVVFLLQVTSR